MTGFLGSPVAVVGLVFSVVSVVLGIGVAYLAVRGYRRSGQKPMLFVAVGFVLFILTPLVLLFGFTLESVDETVLYSAAAISQTVGLISILYGLRTPRDPEASEAQ